MVRVIYFTDRAADLATQITEYTDLVDGREGGVEAALKEAFDKKIDLAFIGAAGIAVRLIAPYIRDKTSDPAVICMDEAGRFVVSLLSGHLGGANDLAKRVAVQIGATPVITTATDVEHTFAVDIFAKNNGLGILNPSAIKTVSSKVLKGEMIPVKTSDPTLIFQEECRDFLRPVRDDERPMINVVDSGWLFSMLDLAGIDPYMPLPDRNTREDLLMDCGVNDRCLYLYEQDLAVGVGCRKGTPIDEIFPFLKDVLMHKGLCMARIGSVSSIDIKKDEPGILGLCGVLKVPYHTYTAGELKAVKGNFSPSQFVVEQVGVDNVCERAAALTAGVTGEKIVGKMKTERVTISIYRKGSI